MSTTPRSVRSLKILSLTEREHVWGRGAACSVCTSSDWHSVRFSSCSDWLFWFGRGVFLQMALGAAGGAWFLSQIICLMYYCQDIESYFHTGYLLQLNDSLYLATHMLLCWPNQSSDWNPSWFSQAMWKSSQPSVQKGVVMNLKLFDLRRISAL